MSFKKKVKRFFLYLTCLFLVCGVFEARAETPKADFIKLEKSKRLLTLFSKGKELKVYRVSLGPVPVGKKEKQGDYKTPEGKYIIDYKNPQSQYHLSLHISYPNKEDKLNAQKMGFSPGGDIMIHGLGKHFNWMGKAHIFFDWTLGCVAVTDEEMDEIWKLVPEGTSIEIVP